MLVNILSRYWWMTLIRGLIWILFGIVVLVQPGISLVSLTLLFGAFAFADGIMAVVHAIGGRHENENWWALLLTGLVGIYTNPRHIIEYTSDGEVRQEFSIVFKARPVGGTPTPSSESSEVVWVDPGNVDDMRMHPSMRQRIEHYREHRAQPYLG